MKPSGLAIFLFLFILPLHAGERKHPVFVSTQWLSDHFSDPDLVVLHVAFNRNEYKAGHIPGARFLWYNWLAVSTPDASTEMPASEQADTILESLGITESSTIVLCFGGMNVSTTTRMLLALSYFGFEQQTSVLDGGFEAWKAENRPISKESPIVARTSVTLQIRPSAIADAEWVKAHLLNPEVTVVDSRTKNFFDGSGGGVARTGHIKGARNIPFTTVLDSTSRLKDVAALQKMFDDAGIERGSTVVAYCHVGQQATVIYAVARLLGYNAAVYDGSFEDWNVRGEEYPVEKTGVQEPPR